jgi:FixJ family two-component response regulator
MTKNQQDVTVFVLDDDAAIRDSLRAVLNVLHVRGEFYSSVDEYWRANDATRRGCLLLDIRLPGDGFGVLREFNSAGIHLPVIVITGHGDSETRDEAMSLGAFGFFQKPFNVPELVSCVRHALAQNTAN